MTDLGEQLHDLEREFGLPSREILDIINRRNRCKIAVRGAIAEAHLIVHLRRLVESGAIDGFEDFDLDGMPDCRVDFGGRSFLVECKNVEKLGETKRPRKEVPPVTIDFWRTRAPVGKAWERYYSPDEFQVLAACLWNRTGAWEFRFAATAELPRHPSYEDRILNRVVVDVAPSVPGEPPLWTPDLPSLLGRF